MGRKAGLADVADLPQHASAASEATWELVFEDRFRLSYWSLAKKRIAT
jgi:hypothetical protein